MGKRKVAGVAKDAVETVFRRIRNKPSEFLLEKASDLIRKFDKGEIKLPELKGQLKKDKTMLKNLVTLKIIVKKVKKYLRKMAVL
jgi:hypothetical protein